MTIDEAIKAFKEGIDYHEEAFDAILAALAASEAARERAERERDDEMRRRAELAALYEEMRRETDGGSESMTHADAIREIRDLKNAYWEATLDAPAPAAGTPATGEGA